MVRLELPGKRPKGTSKGIFMDVVRKGRNAVGRSKEDSVKLHSLRPQQRAQATT